MDRESRNIYHVARQQKVGALVIVTWGVLLAPISIPAAALVASAGMLMLAGLAGLRNVTRFVPAAGRRLAMLAGALLAHAVGTLAAALAVLATAIASITFTPAERNARRDSGGRLARLPNVNLVPRLAARPRAALSAS